MKEIRKKRKILKKDEGDAVFEGLDTNDFSFEEEELETVKVNKKETDFWDKDDELEMDEIEMEDDGDEIDEDGVDLLLFPSNKRKTKLPEGKAIGAVNDIKVESVKSKYEDQKNYNRITIVFSVKHPKTGELFDASFMANRDAAEGKLNKFLTGLLGESPQAGWNMRELKGKKFNVIIKHKEDENGNVWANVVEGWPMR